MPRKTPIYGFNLFYHDDAIIAAEDIRPGNAYTGTLQPDPTNTLNFNFKLMEDLVQSILNGRLAFTSISTVEDVRAGRDVIVGRSLILNPEYGLTLNRDERPSPHLLLDFSDALAHSGDNPAYTFNVTRNGVAITNGTEKNPFRPDLSTLSLSGTTVYPLIFTISSGQPLLNIDLSAQVRLLLAFSAVPQGLSGVRLESSSNGTTFVTVGYYTQNLGARYLLLGPVTLVDPPRALRITLEGTNSTNTNFAISRIALAHAGTPALENFYLPRRGGELWGNVIFRAAQLVFDSDTNLYRSAPRTLRTDNNLAVGENVTARQFVSTATSGTAPLIVSSSTIVNNFNADLVDGLHATSFARVDANSTITQPWTLNANLTVGAGYTLDGVDLSVFKSVYDIHEHNGTDAPRVKAENVLAQPFGGTNYSTNVKSYLDSVQNQINQLVQGATTADSILVRNLTVTQSLSAQGVTAQLGAVQATGASSFGGSLTITTNNSHLRMQESNSDTTPAVLRKINGRLELASGSTSPVRVYRNTSTAVGDLEIWKDDAANPIPSYLRFVQNNKYDILLKGSPAGLEVRNANDTSFLPFRAGNTTIIGTLTVSGTISGNATTASRWQTARTITLNGAVNGSAGVDGSADVFIATSIANGSITGSMLASGAAIANIGYTPVNRVGDTITGNLTVNGLTTSFQGIAIPRSDTNNWGEQMVSFRSSANINQWSIGHHGAPGANNTGNNFTIWRYDNNGSLLSAAFTIIRSNGFVGINRSNPDQRFVVEEHAGPHVAVIRKTGSSHDGSVIAGPTLYVANTRGNHSWGNLAEFRIDQDWDPPHITFTAGWTSLGWSVGMAGPSDSDFAIALNRGWRYNGYGNVLVRVRSNGELISSRVTVQNTLIIPVK